MSEYTIDPATPANDVIDKQERVEAVIEKMITDDNAAEAGNFALQTTAVIASPTAPGVAYDQTEMASLKTAIDAIRAALIASGVTNAA